MNRVKKPTSRGPRPKLYSSASPSIRPEPRPTAHTLQLSHSTPAPPLPPPELTGDLVGEILIRVPPVDPAHLVRAALVCKPWRRILHDPGFLRRYREFHRAPPLLGFLRDRGAHRFVPTTTVAASFCPPAFACGRWWALDCRHGRVLIHSMAIFVWDPVTGDTKRVPLPPFRYTVHTAAVLCASDGCDHLDCHGGPFLVAFVGKSFDSARATRENALLSVYTSETGAWSAPTSVQLSPDSLVLPVPSILAGGALHFNLDNCILKCDLQRGQVLSLINLPSYYQDMWHEDDEGNSRILMIAEDGGLGIASVQGSSTIHLWSRLAASSSDAGWVQCRVIELDKLIPIDIDDPSTELSVVGLVEGSDTIFISTNAAVFAFEVKSGQVRKVAESGHFRVIFPYVSFYTPGNSPIPI